MLLQSQLRRKMVDGISKVGYGFAYRRYSKKFIHDEDYAKLNKLGMWSMEFDYPWDWRKKN